jgi:hypothetical protein
MEEANRNPWLDVKPLAEAVGGRRVDATHPWSFYWAIGKSGRYLLVLYCTVSVQVPEDISEFGGISVSVFATPDKQYAVVLELHDIKDREIFFALCTDLLEATRLATTEKDAIGTLTQRLRRWRRLLQTAKKDRLSDSEIRGLLGELIFLKDVLSPHFGIEAAVLSWQGPTGDAPQDFCVGKTAVEVKARLGTSKGRVEISSFDQLQSQMESLFLHVVTFGIAPPGDGGISLTGVVSAIRSMLANVKADSSFEERLYAAGYADGTDYSNPVFQIVAQDYYHVRDGFPRLQRKHIDPGVLDGRYAIDLGQCTEFLTVTPWGLPSGH